MWLMDLLKSFLPETSFFSRMSHATRFCFLKHAHESSKIEVQFTYEEPRLNFSRKFLFLRDSSETVGTLSNCISEKVLKKMSRKIGKYVKSKQIQDTDDMFRPCVKLYKRGAQIPDDILFKSMLFGDTADSILKVGELSYQLCVNMPCLKKLKLHDHIMAGYEIYPSQLELEFAEIEESVFLWQRRVLLSSPAGKPKTEKWVDVGTGLMYPTSNDDIDCQLRLSCTPVSGPRRGPTVTAVSEPVMASPPIDRSPITRRHCHTPHPLASTNLRVVSYNVLADYYADSDFSRTELFPYCPPFALSSGYRRQLLLHELSGYHADLLCLQEVDDSVFERALLPGLRRRGLSGVVHCKGQGTPEGLACFWRDSKLREVSSERLVLSEVIFEDPVFEDVVAACCRCPPLETQLAGRRQILQLVVLERKSDGHLMLVANTHLYSHPDADRVRAVQAGCCLRLVETRLHQLRSQFLPRQVDLLFCGDFNSCPASGAFRLMTEGALSENYPDSQSQPEEELPGLQFSHALSLASACGRPAYTNRAGTFSSCLDYIFYQTDRLTVHQVIPLPSDEEVTAHTALPSVFFPSDHLALVADLVWKPTTGE